MLDPADLFEVVSPLPELGEPVLVLALDGFVDAGSAVRIVRDHLLARVGGEVVVTFDVDQLYDYRARRPEMLFASDHWESYADPQLAIHVIRDADEKPFLLLAGPEPDTQWERFAAAIQLIVARLGVGRMIGLNAIPMGVPHTRPAGVIAHANPPELVADYNSWLGTVTVPASALHLLEYRLGQAGVEAMGFAANVPHYLAHLDYPAAAVTLIENVAKAGHLALPTDVLEAAAAITRADVDEQVEKSEEVATVVHGLERQYDDIVSGRARNLIADGGRLPTADEIGAEFEQYLSQQPENGDE